MRFLHVNLILCGLCLGMLTLLPSAPVQARPDDDRSLFVIAPNRVIKETGRRRWTEFINRLPDRRFEELRRTRSYVELYTESPQATWVRIFDNRLYWRVSGDSGWRAGAFGQWRDFSRFPDRFDRHLDRGVRK